MVNELILGVSLLFNIALTCSLFYLARKPPVQVKEVKTVDAVDILRDLTAYGSSLVKIQRIDPSDLYVRGTK